MLSRQEGMEGQGVPMDKGGSCNLYQEYLYQQCKDFTPKSVFRAALC